VDKPLSLWRKARPAVTFPAVGRHHPIYTPKLRSVKWRLCYGRNSVRRAVRRQRATKMKQILMPQWRTHDVWLGVRSREPSSSHTVATAMYCGQWSSYFRPCPARICWRCDHVEWGRRTRLGHAWWPRTASHGDDWLPASAPDSAYTARIHWLTGSKYRRRNEPAPNITALPPTSSKNVKRSPTEKERKRRQRKEKVFI